MGAGEYAAGLWVKNIFQDILWHTDRKTMQAEQWRAPSWSWASMQHGIRLYNHIHDDTTEQIESSQADGLFHLELCSSSPVSSGMGAELLSATILEINCPLLGKDPTGQVCQQSSITISAPLLEMSIEEGHLNIPVLKRDELRFEVFWDCLLEAREIRESGLHVPCLWINTSSIDVPLLLVLRKSVGICGIGPTAHAFERVGVLDPRIRNPAHIQALKKWFYESSVETIKIV